MVARNTQVFVADTRIDLLEDALRDTKCNRNSPFVVFSIAHDLTPFWYHIAIIRQSKDVVQKIVKPLGISLLFVAGSMNVAAVAKS